MASPEAVMIGVSECEAPVQQQMIQLPSYYQALAQRDGLEIQEKASMIEAATALLGVEVEMANKYRIFDDSGKHQIFFAVEQTSCWTRQVKSCCGECAPWHVDILYTENGMNQLAFKLDRPWTCTCCCLSRPRIHVIDAITGEELGSIVHPCACCRNILDPCAACTYHFDIRDNNDDTHMTVNGGCCQCGLMCPLPCGPCAYVQFPIFDTTSGEQVANIEKEVPSCCKWCFASDVQNYKVEFQKVQDVRHKIMLMAMPIFLDFRFFNDNKNDELGTE